MNFVVSIEILVARNNVIACGSGNVEVGCAGSASNELENEISESDIVEGDGGGNGED